MCPKRVRPTDSTTTAKQDTVTLLNAHPDDSPVDRERLRQRVKSLVDVLRSAKRIGVTQVQIMLPETAASERILSYLRLFVGEQIAGEELEVVSGISEYARRVREWRVEFGWPIRHEKGTYVLERDEPDESKAELWRTLNQIRRTNKAARDKMLGLFLALPVNTVVTTSQLRYVTEGKDMRRVRELRTQSGWRIMTNKTGLPQLKNGQYILVDKDAVEEHDRHVDQEIIIQVLKRDGNRCQKCGWHPHDRVQGDPRQYIELHHVTWHVQGGANDAANLVTLCNLHHASVHRLKLEAAPFAKWLSEKTRSIV